MTQLETSRLDPAPVVRQRRPGPVPLGQGPGGGPLRRLGASHLRGKQPEDHPHRAVRGGHLRGAAQGRRRRSHRLRGCVSHGDTGGEGRAGDFGYWIARPYWGQGLVPEAVEELLRWQFQEMGVQRVWCAHSPENEKSRRVQEKCGFRHVCDTPPSPWPDGTERPGVCQAITRQEWEVRHGG